MSFLRIIEVGRHYRMPDVAQIYSRAGGKASAIGHAVDHKTLGKHLIGASFGREHLIGIATIGHGLGDAPVHIALTHIAYGLAAERIGFMKQETAFEVGKFHRFVIVFAKSGTALLYVLLSATAPCSFGRRQHIGIQIVLTHYIAPRLGFGVVPDGSDGARHIVGAALLVVDIAPIDARQVGIDIEMIDVIISAIDVRQALYGFSGCGTHLRHIANFGCGSTCREAVPHKHFFALAAHILRHNLQEIGIMDIHLIAAYVDVGREREILHHLIDDYL